MSSLNYQKDSAAQLPLAAAGDGVDAVVRYYENGTDEVRNLLKSECSMVYECSFCRSLFRSIINFVAHKRTVCRSLLSTVRAEQLELVKKSEQEGKTRQGKRKEREGEASTSRRNLRNPNSLRRFNPASSLTKHIRTVNVHLERTNANIEIPALPKVMRPAAKTTLVEGKQIIEELPIELVVKDQIPSNLTPLVMPSENSTRYGDMQLRRRRSAQNKKGSGSSSRELTPDEIAIVERIPTAMPVDFVNLRCEDERCTGRNQQAFHHLSALAHHLAVHHQVDYSDGSLLKKSSPYIQCYICDIPPFKTLEDLQKHFNVAHSSVRTEHNKCRMEQLDPKRKETHQSYRARSLTPSNNDGLNGFVPIYDEKQQNTPIEMISEKKSEKKQSKPIQLPELKSQEEEREQVLSAAFALGKWYAAKQQREGSDEGSNSNQNAATPEGGGNSSKNAHSTDTAYKSGSPRVEQIIDEEEAREIDKLLNSKTPVMGEPNGMLGEEEGAESSLTVQHRSPRPRRPNKKYENEDFGENAKKRNVKGRKSETPVETAKVDTASNRGSEARDKEGPVPLKRKRSLPEMEVQKAKIFKRKKIGFVPLKKTVPISDDEDAAKKEMAAAPSLVAESEIRDFVLPEWMSDKNKDDGHGAAGKEGRDRAKEQGPLLEDAANSSERSSSNEEAVRNPVENAPTTSSAAAGNGPAKEATPPFFIKEKQLPSMVTERHKEKMVLYSPKALALRNAVKGKGKKHFYSEPSRRKQNLNELEEGDGLSMLGTNVSTPAAERPVKVSAKEDRGPPPPKPKDLALVPVYVTEDQRDLFFKPLKSLFNKNVQSDGPCQCGECGQMLRSVKDGRRHMVSHIRVIRMRCSLCDVGAFFCSDMRIHLMYRNCEKLNLAPEEFISPDSPCMDKEKADMLTQLVDPYNPGRIMYTTGKIVSCSNPKAYYPDPKIERNILGPVLPGYCRSPSGSPRKLIRSNILSPKKARPVANKEEGEEARVEGVDGPCTSSQLEAQNEPKLDSVEESQTTAKTKCWNAVGDHDYPIEEGREVEESGRMC